MINKIFLIIAMPFNAFLDLLPFTWFRPIAILGMSFLLGYYSTSSFMKLKWLRIIGLTFAFYLAFTALGVQ